MATLTVRIDDETRDALQAQAEEARQTLSDFVRDRLHDAVFSFRDAPQIKSEGWEPDTLSPLDRHKLALLHRILARVLPEDSKYEDGDVEEQLGRAKVLERGFTNEYPMEFVAIQAELSPRHCNFVMDVLDMFRVTQISIQKLKEQGTEVADALERGLKFRGFDHNDRLESQMSEYVLFLINEDKWAEQKDFVVGRERGNSHHQTIPEYSRMLTEYRGVKQNRTRNAGAKSHLFSEEELRTIAAARVHPSNR